MCFDITSLRSILDMYQAHVSQVQVSKDLGSNMLPNQQKFDFVEFWYGNMFSCLHESQTTCFHLPQTCTFHLYVFVSKSCGWSKTELFEFFQLAPKICSFVEFDELNKNLQSELKYAKDWLRYGLKTTKNSTFRRKGSIFQSFQRFSPVYLRANPSSKSFPGRILHKESNGVVKIICCGDRLRDIVEKSSANLFRLLKSFFLPQ